MYELTCPACQHKVRLPFLRSGAMAVCRQCAHRFQVEPEHIRRRVTVPADTGIDADNPLLLGYPVERPPPPLRPPSRPKVRRSKRAPDDQGIPISDLVGQPKVELLLRPIQPVLKYEEPSEDVAREIALHRSERGRGRRLVWLAVISFVVLLAVGTLLIVQVLRANPDLSGPGRRPGPESPAGGRRGTGGAVADLPRVNATLLAAPDWQRVAETLSDTMPPSVVTLVEGQFAPGAPGQRVYLAQLQVDAPDLIESADLHLMLLDDTGQVFASSDVPLMLLVAGTDQNQRHPMGVSVPRALADRAVKVVPWAKVRRYLPGGVMLDRIAFEAKGSGRSTRLNITARNPLDRPMPGAVFFVRAFDRRHTTVARWRVVWDRRIDARQRVAFTALMQTEFSWAIDDWEVVGAGAPEP